MEGKFPEGQHTAKRGRHLPRPVHSPLTGALRGVEKAQGLGSEDTALGLSTDTNFSNLGMVSGLAVGGVPGCF